MDTHLDEPYYSKSEFLFACYPVALNRSGETLFPKREIWENP